MPISVVPPTASAVVVGIQTTDPDTRIQTETQTDTLLDSQADTQTDAPDLCSSSAQTNLEQHFLGTQTDEKKNPEQVVIDKIQTVTLLAPPQLLKDRMGKSFGILMKEMDVKVLWTDSDKDKDEEENHLESELINRRRDPTPPVTLLPRAPSEPKKKKTMKPTPLATSSVVLATAITATAPKSSTIFTFKGVSLIPSSPFHSKVVVDSAAVSQLRLMIRLRQQQLPFVHTLKAHAESTTTARVSCGSKT